MADRKSVNPSPDPGLYRAPSRAQSFLALQDWMRNHPSSMPQPNEPSPPKNEPVRDLADDDSGNEVDYETSLVREEANNDLHEVFLPRCTSATITHTERAPKGNQQGLPISEPSSSHETSPKPNDNDTLATSSDSSSQYMVDLRGIEEVYTDYDQHLADLRDAFRKDPESDEVLQRLERVLQIHVERTAAALGEFVDEEYNADNCARDFTRLLRIIVRSAMKGDLGKRIIHDFYDEPATSRIQKLNIESDHSRMPTLEQEKRMNQIRKDWPHEPRLLHNKKKKARKQKDPLIADGGSTSLQVGVPSQHPRPEFEENCPGQIDNALRGTEVNALLASEGSVPHHVSGPLQTLGNDPLRPTEDGTSGLVFQYQTQVIEASSGFRQFQADQSQEKTISDEAPRPQSAGSSDNSDDDYPAGTLEL